MKNYEPHSHCSLSLSHVVSGRLRMNSESHASTVYRDEELQAKGDDEAGTPTDGAPFRARSKSAPPALWAAKKYGQQLRRMSDEFDSLLDKGVRMRGQRIEEGLKREIKLFVVIYIVEEGARKRGIEGMERDWKVYKW